MSQPKTPISSITDMANSVISQPSWLLLMKSSLFHQAMNKVGYVSADIDCAIIYGPEPAVFNDCQTLAPTHYHVDACLWMRDIFIDGGTFLVPSKLPEASLERYLVDLDDSTGIHHVTLRKVSLRTTLPLTSLSNPNFSSHIVEFSNGEMTAVPRVNFAATNSKRKTRKTPSREYQWDSSIVQPRPVRDIVRQVQFGSCGQDSEVEDQVAKNGPNISYKTMSAPTRSDSSIIGSGRVVGQQAANFQSSISNFSESVIHIVSRTKQTTTAIEGDSSITRSGRVVGRQAADDQSSLSNFSKSIVHIVPRDSPKIRADTQTSNESSIPRRSSAGSQGSGLTASTVPTTPSPSPFSTLLFWKLAAANLPEVPIAPGRNDLAVTEEGRIILAEDASRNVPCSSPSPQSTPEPVEALPSFFADKDDLFDALDVVRIEFVGQPSSPLFALDLVPEAKGKQRATDVSTKQQFPPVCDEADVEIAIDSASGELYLRPKITAPVVVQSISAGTGTNTANGGSVPTQDQLSSDSGAQPIRFEDVDLTYVFNQGATDLDDEEEEEGCTVPSTIASHIIGSRLAQTLSIPSEHADYVEYMIQAQPHIPRIVVEANEYWNFLKATIDGTWYAQGCPKGYLTKRPFHEKDSDAKLRELLGLGRKLIVPTESPQDLRVGFPVHHFNLIGQPVFQESWNPSAVSYWAAMASCWKEQIQDSVSWKAVVSSQAAKWVDPCTLDGDVEIPDDLRARGTSTALRDFLTGQTTIRYEPWGTWISDRYDPDQQIPEVMSPECSEAFLKSFSAANMFPGLQRPYVIGPADRDVNVNDAGTATRYPYAITKEEKGWKSLDSCGSTNLRFVHDDTEQAYSLKGMKESKIWEFLEKHETLDIVVTGLPIESKPNIAVEETLNKADSAVNAESKNTIINISNEADADGIKDDASEAETEIPDEVVLRREPVHYQGAAIEELEAKEHAKIESTKLPEYIAETALEDGKAMMNEFKARSYELVSITDEDGNSEEDSDYESIAGAGFDDTDYSSTWSKRPEPEDHPKAQMLAQFAEKSARLRSRSDSSGQGLILSGRNLSPTKMLSSVMGQPETPPQSPEAAEDFGVWEDDGNGGFESPGKYRPQYEAKDVNGQGDQFDDDVGIFDSETKEATAAAQAAFHEAMVLANTKSASLVADRMTNLTDEEAPATPVRSKVGVLSPIRENSQTPVQRYRAPHSIKSPWIPNFTRVGNQTRRAVAKPISIESSIAHSRNSSSCSDAVSSQNGNTHTRNTSVTTTSSAENGSTHTRNTSLTEAKLLKEEYDEELASWDVAKRKGYAASRMAQFDSPVRVPAILEAAALRSALPSPSMEHEAKGSQGGDKAGEKVKNAENGDAGQAIEVAENELDGSSEEAPLALPFDPYGEKAPSVAAPEEQNEVVNNAISAPPDSFEAHTSHFLLVVAIIVAFLWHFV